MLERIRAEKQRLIKQGKIKKDKGDSVIFKGDDNCYYEKCGSEVKNITEELPFEIPDSWCWTKLGSLITVISGVSYDKKDVCSQGIRILRGGNIYDQKIHIAEDDVFLPQKYYDPDKQVQKDDIVIVASTGSKTVIGKSGFANKDYPQTEIGAFLRIVRPFYNDIAEYLKTIFATEYYREHIRTQAQGTNINNVKAEYITELKIPFPPIQEQKRIVAEIEKYEPLIAEYDKLEQQATKLDDEIYSNLKKSILQYAIQGKLVPQDPNDEPASVLLARIRAEKKAQLGKKYVESYIYKGGDNCYYEKVGKNEPIKLEDLPFDIPDTWAWARLGNIVEFENGDRSQKYPVESDYVSFGIPFWGAKDIINNKLTVTSNLRYISQDKFDELNNGKLQDKDFICLLRGAVGKWATFDETETIRTGFINAQMVIIRANIKDIIEWLKTYFSSPLFISLRDKYTSGTAVAQMSAKDLSRFLIPIPPQAEQERICLKIKKMLQCIEKDEI